MFIGWMQVWHFGRGLAFTAARDGQNATAEFKSLTVGCRVADRPAQKLSNQDLDTHSACLPYTARTGGDRCWDANVLAGCDAWSNCETWDCQIC